MLITLIQIKIFISKKNNIKKIEVSDRFLGIQFNRLNGGLKIEDLLEFYFLFCLKINAAIMIATDKPERLGKEINR